MDDPYPQFDSPQESWGPGNYKVLFIGGVLPIPKRVKQWIFDPRGAILYFVDEADVVYNGAAIISVEKEK